MPNANYSVLIVAQSGPGYFGSRSEVRRTWGSVCKKASWCKLVFSLGMTANETIQRLVETESGEFGDILQDPFHDSYNNLTVKTLYILRYFLRQTSFPFLLKTDDDAFIGVLPLRDAIRQEMIAKGKELLGGLQANKRHPQPMNSTVTWFPATVYRPSFYNAQRMSMRKWMIPRYSAFKT